MILKKHHPKGENKAVVEDVSTELNYMIDDALESIGDNLAVVMSDNVRSYDPEWCPADYGELVKNPAMNEFYKAVDQAKRLLINAQLKLLFMDAPDEIKQYV